MAGIVHLFFPHFLANYWLARFLSEVCGYCVVLAYKLTKLERGFQEAVCSKMFCTNV